MSDRAKEFKRTIGVKWVRARSGNTYLCPADELSRLVDPSEADLMRIGIDESNNPENG